MIFLFLSCQGMHAFAGETKREKRVEETRPSQPSEAWSYYHTFSSVLPSCQGFGHTHLYLACGSSCRGWDLNCNWPFGISGSLHLCGAGPTNIVIYFIFNLLFYFVVLYFVLEGTEWERRKVRKHPQGRWSCQFFILYSLLLILGMHAHVLCMFFKLLSLGFDLHSRPCRI